MPPEIHFVITSKGNMCAVSEPAIGRVFMGNLQTSAQSYASVWAKALIQRRALAESSSKSVISLTGTTIALTQSGLRIAECRLQIAELRLSRVDTGNL